MTNPFIKFYAVSVFALMAFPSIVLSSPNLTDYEMVFNDEFNSPTLDTTKWGSTHLWGPYVEINQEKQHYIDSLGEDAGHAYNPFVLNGSTLRIQAVPTTPNLTAPPQPNQNDAFWAANPEFQYNANYDPQTRDYLSGILTSVDNFNFTHGYVESRIKLPEGQGLWSAFWLLTSKYVENAPEIDIMEALGHTPDTVHHTMHYFDIQNNWQTVSTPTFDTVGLDFTNEFHVYGVSWSPTSLTWYVNGEPVRTLTNDDFKIPTQSMYVLLNLAVGGSWPGNPDSTTQFPASMEVDYVRTYRKKPSVTVTPSVLASDYQLMFEDNFNGSVLDPAKWNTSYLWGPYFPINQEQQIYIDKNGRHADSPLQPFSLDGGILTIEASPLSASEIPAQPPADDPEWSVYNGQRYNEGYGTSAGWTPKYASGLMTSYESFKFVNGYVEARMKLPEGGGLWPAFWLLNGYYVGPQPEIDIMELDGAFPNSAHQSYHYSNNFGQLQSSATQSQSSTGSFTDDFHVFAVQWDAEQIVWYVDGVAVRTLQGPEVSTQLMYILLNLAVGGNFVGAIDDAQIPAKLEIDYVRAYQRKNHEFYCEGMAATILGTDGNDTLVGTAGADVIVGMGGNDVIDGAGGDDIICGGFGDDTLNGGAGNNVLIPGPGNDLIDGYPDTDGDGIGDNIDPDDDNDGIADALDENPLIADNNCTSGNASVAVFAELVSSNVTTCAANVHVTVSPPAQVQSTGHLKIIAPLVTIESGFNATALTVKSVEPCVSCQ